MMLNENDTTDASPKKGKNSLNRASAGPFHGKQLHGRCIRLILRKTAIRTTLAHLMNTAITAQPPITQPATRVRWLIFVLACAASWLLYLHRYSWGVIKPALRQEYPGFTSVELGWLDSVFMAVYGIGQVPGGLVGDLFGPRRILALLILLWSIALMFLALAQGYLVLALGLGILGLCQAGVYPNLNKVTRSWFPLSIRCTCSGSPRSWMRKG